MYKTYCRLYQRTFKLVSPLLPWREPQLIEGENAVHKLPKVIKDLGIGSVLIVTDQGITSIGLMDGLLQDLKEENLDVVYLIERFQTQRSKTSRMRFSFITHIIVKELSLLAAVHQWIAQKELEHE
jgi:hypothetical protein